MAALGEQDSPALDLLLGRKTAGQLLTDQFAPTPGTLVGVVVVLFLVAATAGFAGYWGVQAATYLDRKMR